MFKTQVKDRYSAQKCLEHIWFHEIEHTIELNSPDCARAPVNKIEINVQVVEKMRKFKHGSKLRIALLNILVK